MYWKDDHQDKNILSISQGEVLMFSNIDIITVSQKYIKIEFDIIGIPVIPQSNMMKHII